MKSLGDVIKFCLLAEKLWIPCPCKCSRPGCGLEQPDLMSGIPDCVSGVGLDDLYGVF